jgi:dolichol-phosphate mannosyltransferase
VIVSAAADSSVSVVIPTRNEAPSVGEVIRRCRSHATEILVVDGHSTDATRAIAREHGARVLLDNGRGKGAAVRAGIAAARGDVLVFIDADGSHDPEDIPRLVAPIAAGHADLVIGSRMRGGSDELHGELLKFVRMVGSDIITLGINYRFGAALTDTQNGFRAIRAARARDLVLEEDLTTIEQEMVIKALGAGLRVAEVAAHEHARQHGTSRIRLRQVWLRYVYSWAKYLLFPGPGTGGGG